MKGEIVTYQDIKDENLKEEVVMSVIMNQITRDEIDELQLKTPPKAVLDGCKMHVEMFVARHKLGNNSESPMCRDLIRVMAYELMIQEIKDNISHGCQCNDVTVKNAQDALILYAEMLKYNDNFNRAETHIIRKAYTTSLLDATNSIGEMIKHLVLVNLDEASVVIESFNKLKDSCNIDNGDYEAFIYHFTVDELAEYVLYLV